VASFRTVCLDGGGRTSTEVVAFNDSLDETEDADVILQLVALDGATTVHTRAIGANDAPVSLEHGAGELVCLQVVNGRRIGEGSRPELCFGSGAEVDDCLAEFSDNPSGEGEGEGEGTDGGDDPPVGCGCGASSAADTAPILLALAVLRRFRWRRASRA
jgi:hypothetical protein